MIQGGQVSLENFAESADLMNELEFRQEFGIDEVEETQLK